MTTLQKAFETCQADKSAWLQRRAELAQTEQAYREQLAADNRNGQRLQMLREIIDVKKWEINQAAGRYIRSHEEVQRISIRNPLPKIPPLSRKKPCMHKAHGFACVLPTRNPPPAPVLASPDAANAPALKTPR